VKHTILIFFCFWIVGCNTYNNDRDLFLTAAIPSEVPILFKPELIEDNTIVHRGIFSNDFNEYYFTVSDNTFSNFDIKISKKQNGVWTAPVNTIFNSQFNDHGMSFSPDGKALVFSSTRPVGVDEIPSTWHIWRCEKRNQKWSEPEFVEIPGLRQQLTSHPTLANDGTLYFHASDLDYSKMAIYYSKPKNGRYQNAKKMHFETLNAIGYCTPYISSNGQHLIFATIGERLDLYICNWKGQDEWSAPTKLPELINQNGQGNPYLTPDSRYLFYVSQSKDEGNRWNVNWVKTTSFLKE
jgi:Tol biopolymer transport system component